MRRLSVILLVDPRGWVLLQERDEHAPISPNKWGMVGGHVDDGEDFELAAYRELEEETGVRLEQAGGSLRLWREEQLQYADADELHHYQVRVAATRLTDDDIVLGEGRQIVFVHPDEIPALDTNDSCTHFVSAFLASQEYVDLVGELAE